jgi:hypothetical protein
MLFVCAAANPYLSMGDGLLGSRASASWFTASDRRVVDGHAARPGLSRQMAGSVPGRHHSRHRRTHFAKSALRSKPALVQSSPGPYAHTAALYHSSGSVSRPIGRSPPLIAA